MLPRKRGEPANAVRICGLGGGLAVIYDRRGLAADGLAAPENTRRTERYNGEIYAELVRLADFGFVGEGLWPQCHGRDAFLEQILFSVGHLFGAVFGRAMLVEQIQVGLDEGVCVSIDDGRNVYSSDRVDVDFAFDGSI